MELDLPPIPKRIESFDPSLGAVIASALRQNGHRSSAASDWVEKLRRFVEINRADLKSVARKRFGAAHYRQALAAIADTLSAAAARGLRSDLVYLNAALWALDAANLGENPAPAIDQNRPGRFAASTVRDLLERLRNGPVLDDIVSVDSESGWATAESLDVPKSGSLDVVVFCPQPRSLYTLSTLALLARAKITVRAVVVRRLGVSRFLHESRMHGGAKLLWKVWRKLVLQSSENPGDPSQTLAGLASELGVAGMSVKEYGRQIGIPCYAVDDFNGDATVELLQKLQVFCVAFTGGGLISERTIQSAGLGIINCHMGILPQYKGMDVVEWPLLEGVPNLVGATTHLMAKGVDTGPILSGIRVDPAHYASVPALRNAIERSMPQLLCDTIEGLQRGTIVPRVQRAAGRQYFLLHPLLEVLLPSALRHVIVRR
ncbi:MAG: hypothetical protein HY243_04100 [Proteobacteria bacterium]|nr:hypothetical protein [Pseudomonadota bacterium]